MRTALLVVLAAAACEGRPSAESELPPLPDGARGFVPASLASSERLPERLGFGRAASPEEIARVDIDIMPDGRGLPPGRGTSAGGATVYAAKCAGCHGPQGEGSPAGAALVGRNPSDAFDFSVSGEKERSKTIGNYWPHATTLFDYIRRAMPLDRPGSLTDEEVYALTAYLLHSNEIIAKDAVMDASTLPQVRMPARDRFRPDDRESSTRVR